MSIYDDMRYELEGVLADVHNSNGFDDVCEQTIKRVANALGQLADEATESSREPACYSPRPPQSMVDATHWAETPSGEILYYRIERGRVILWRPYSRAWDLTEDAPYTLHCFPFGE